MKIEKINIIKEIIDIPDNSSIIKILKQKNKNFIKTVNEKSDISDIMEEREEENWLVQETKDMYGQKKKCLVRDDDRNLFTELIEITNSVLKKKIRKEVAKIKSEEEYDAQWAIDMEIDKIKSLPFWKRLLKQF